MPAPLVVMGAQIMCPMGAAPQQLVVIPKGVPVMAEGKLVATIQDAIPFTNILPFGICNSPSNPAAVTAKAAGATAPCTPVTVAWTPGVPLVLVNGTPAVNATCTCQCALGVGPITIVNPGTTKELA
ncbi:MAG TPA: DUF4280 domain-containing protein [Candidatus Limnocylindrales bacterium]|nr:DUF4280 domain-containing protein [Candidatus Limnocylindrales bacterium]